MGLHPRDFVAALIVLCATALYVVSILVGDATAVEPQSVFTLYGAVLGYLFGVKEGERRERREPPSQE